VGKLYVYRTPNKIVVNFPTKKSWRQPSRLEYIEAGLQKFIDSYALYGISSVSFPQLGCGNGELDWESQVRPIMEHYLKDLPIPVYIHIFHKPKNFVPERIDKNYAQEVQLERQRVSVNQLWQDLQSLFELSKANDITPLLGITDNEIMFKLDSGETISVHKEDVDNLWNVLRLKGTLREDDIPTNSLDRKTVHWFLNLMAKLPYIRMVKLAGINEQLYVQGISYLPLASDPILLEQEMII
jgi:hypothetical protein